jgi:phosphoglycolate phosphatase-like HAD superfamily hydrolase
VNLAVFDVDGTLLRNHSLEDECYAAALRHALGLRALDVDWTQYHDVSDAGIAIEAFRRELASLPSAVQLGETVRHFVSLLKAACNADSAAIVPVLGAERVFAALAARGWAVAIATGAWRDAVEFKLRVAGIDYSHIPMATSEDGPARTSIIATAQSRAEQYHCVERFARVVSIGDAI